MVYQIKMTQKPVKILKLIRIFLLRHDIETRIYLEKSDQCYTLYITGRIDKAIFLNRILPYLIVKKDKAEECLEWIKQRENAGEKGVLHITEKRKINKLINQGFSQHRIAKEIGRSQPTISNYCKREASLN